jgi:hypothetical protein
MRNLTIEELRIVGGGRVISDPNPATAPPGTYNIGQNITVYVGTAVSIEGGGGTTQHAPLQAL